MGLFQTTVIVLLAHHVFDLNKVIDYCVPAYIGLALLVVASYALHNKRYPPKAQPMFFRLAPKQPEQKKDMAGRPDFSGVWKSTRTENYTEFLVAQVSEFAITCVAAFHNPLIAVVLCCIMGVLGTEQGVNGIAARIAANASVTHTIHMDNENFNLTIAGPAGKFVSNLTYDAEPVESRMKAKVFYDTVRTEGNTVVYTKESKQDNFTIVATRTFENGGAGKKMVRG